jgi:hypothetical protein
MKTTIDMAREAGFEAMRAYGLLPHVPEDIFIANACVTEEVKRLVALVRADERERICKAIEEEDEYCVTEGDYMLDSDDCIAVTKGVWVRPEFNLEPIRARGKT